MEKYIAGMVEMIKVRKSRRKFLNTPIEPEKWQELTDFCKKIAAPFKHDVNITLHQSELNFLPFLKRPAYFAAFNAPGGLLNMAQAGFVGELFILYATGLELGTCWYGHYEKKVTYEIVYGTSGNEAPKVIHCITPLGYVTEKITGLSDRMTIAMFSDKKEPVENRLHADSLKDFPEPIYYSLDLARMAPSALNTQHWYYKVSCADNSRKGNCWKVEIAKPAGFRHIKWAYPDIDVGTCACHFWLGLKNRKINPEVNITEADDRVIWEFSFVV